MSDVGELHQVLAPLLMMIVIIAIAPGPGLLPVSPFYVIKITIIGGEGKVGGQGCENARVFKSS